MTTSGIPRKLVLQLALIFEGLLCLVAIIWISLRHLEIPVDFSSKLLLWGFLLALPLLGFNFWLFYQLPKRLPRAFQLFLDEVISPLCTNLDLPSALLIGIFSGVAEELFFRGILSAELQNLTPLWLSVVIVNVLFAYVHFIGSVSKYAPLLPVYFLIGAYLSMLNLYFSSLVPAMVCHGFYNFCAMLFIRYVYLPRKK